MWSASYIKIAARGGGGLASGEWRKSYAHETHSQNADINVRGEIGWNSLPFL